jgi:hypothetical protein
MTDQRLAGELPAPDRPPAGAGGTRADRPPAGASGTRADRARRRSAVSLSEILAVCDRELGEVGRRDHLFTWLRAPGGGVDAWLPVDAYYPRHRLVVLYQVRGRANADVYRELIPAHGLRLLELTPADLVSSSGGAERALASILAQLAPPPAPAAQPPLEAPRHHDLWARVSARAQSRRPTTPARSDGHAPPSPTAARSDGHPPPSAAERASQFLTTRAARGTRRAPAPASAESPLAGVAVGVVLVLVLIVAAIYIASTVGG